jgi:hypothetical protein
MSRDYMIDGDRVEAGTSTLMRQAQMTAHDYMAQARHDIDEVFGERYAISHPELIAAYMQTAALDFGAAVIARAIQQLGDRVESFAEAITEPPAGR